MSPLFTVLFSGVVVVVVVVQVVSESDFSEIFENYKYLFNLTNRTIALHIKFWKTRQIVQIIL